MPFGRIQKLLCDEYRQFQDTVLIESPFAETTRDGHGLEQVHLGITPTKLIIACDCLEPMCDVVWCGQDPEVETLELMSLYPVEFVNLSVYRKRRRQLLKANFANNVTRYFELGGLEKRKMFWNLWCERVLHLNPERNGSESEISSSSTPRGSPGTFISWKTCHYRVTAKGTDLETAQIRFFREVKRPRWTDRNLFLGNRREKDDEIRSSPIVGMGDNPDLRFLYVSEPLKKYADSSDQKPFQNLRDVCDYDVYTYTGGPTSNVTYTSIAKAFSSAGRKST